jgi:sec-independent protein translocase protein TatC
VAEQQHDMSFLEHLEELRRRLFWSVASVIVGIIVVVVYHDFVIDEIIMGPRKPDFITYRAFCSWSNTIGMGDALCLDPPRLTLQSTTMSGNMNADIMVCIVGGIILAFPFIIWQLWGFIKPGLKDKETKSVRVVVFYVSL